MCTRKKVWKKKEVNDLQSLEDDKWQSNEAAP